MKGQTPVVSLILSRKGALVALAGEEVEDMVEVMEEVDMEEDSAVMVEGIRIAGMEVDTKVTKREEVEEKIFSTFSKCFRMTSVLSGNISYILFSFQGGLVQYGVSSGHKVRPKSPGPFGPAKV